MKNSPAVCLVFTSWPSAPSAEQFAHAAIEAGLAACVHISGAGLSIYRWEGRVEQTTEHQVVVKTTRASVAALEVLLSTTHPYELPEYVVCDAAASDAYGRWVHDSVDGGAAPEEGR